MNHRHCLSGGLSTLHVQPRTKWDNRVELQSTANLPPLVGRAPLSKNIQDRSSRMFRRCCGGAYTFAWVGEAYPPPFASFMIAGILKRLKKTGGHLSALPLREQGLETRANKYKSHFGID